MVSYSLLFDTGWLFLAAWSLIVGALGVTAFGRDLLPPDVLELSDRPRSFDQGQRF